MLFEHFNSVLWLLNGEEDTTFQPLYSVNVDSIPQLLRFLMRSIKYRFYSISQFQTIKLAYKMPKEGQIKGHILTSSSRLDSAESYVNFWQLHHLCL